jgi:hypothetical protein
MKLVLLIVAAVAILGIAAASYIHYSQWREHRFDEMIADAANRHGLDPALVKALIRVQAELPLEANERRHGLMQISEQAATLYLQDNERRARQGETTYLPKEKHAWGYICVHRRFRNHDPNKPELYTSSDTKRQPRCLAPGCGQPLIYEPLDPEINLEIGCWALREMQRLLRTSDPTLSPNELERRMLVAYRYGLPRGAFTTTAEQERFVAEVTRRQVQYHPTFEHLAAVKASAAAPRTDP